MYKEKNITNIIYTFPIKFVCGIQREAAFPSSRGGLELGNASVEVGPLSQDPIRVLLGSCDIGD